MSTTATRITPDGKVRLRINAVGSMIAATVDAVGAEASGFERGDRVALPTPKRRFSDSPIVSAENLIGVPKDVTDAQVAEILAPGLVAHALLLRGRVIGAGDRVHVAVAHSVLRDVIEAWSRALGARIVADPADASVVIDDAARRAATEAAYRKGRLQLAAIDVFHAIRAGVFDSVKPARGTHPTAA
jgi:D-arabinose 1-dehydrogenase-like Zn-dependent alcohol dehydrogenase